MTTLFPRIAEVAPLGNSEILVTWQDGGIDKANLAGWIGTGGNFLAPLAGDDVFLTARVGEYGASVAWGPEDGDMAIDAHHLRQIITEQRPFCRSDLVSWQAELGLSNQEAAEFLGVSLSTWNAYRANGPMPLSVGIICRAARRDPILLQAHYRPRKPGRPRRADGPSAA